MKKLLSLFLVLAMCFSFASCVINVENSAVSENTSDNGSTIESSTEQSFETESEATSEPTSEATSEPTSEPVSEDIASTSTPLLYKVTDNKGNVAWLFGSIHIGLEEYYPLPDYIMNAFNSSDALAVEFDVVAFQEDEDAMMKCLTSMVYQDGTTISDHISEEVYTEAKKILEENELYDFYLDYYMPCFWESLISELSHGKYGVVKENGVDEHMLKAAKEKSMEIIDIESPEFQYGMMASFSDELQEVLLSDAISVYETGEGFDELKEMMNIWMLGNEEEIKESLETDTTDMPEEIKDLYYEYNNAVLTERDKKMTEFAISSLESGKEVFIVVGAAHVVCENAMVDQLSQKGYTVEKVSP